MEKMYCQVNGDDDAIPFHYIDSNVLYCQFNTEICQNYLTPINTLFDNNFTFNLGPQIISSSITTIDSQTSTKIRFETREQLCYNDSSSNRNITYAHRVPFQCPKPFNSSDMITIYCQTSDD